MTDLPSGTVTFLFTDIEGSTRLLHELGDEAYGEALGDHRRKLRAAFAHNRGVEVDTQGDSFFVAFVTAQDALAAAAEAHEALRDGRVRVRIGVHTGAPLLIDGDYVGADLHRAARIAASAHGGQTVASAATAPATFPRSDRSIGRTCPFRRRRFSGAGLRSGRSSSS
jgi:class 3 adenylate cyclase